jgi:hypothetical protein
VANQCWLLAVRVRGRRHGQCFQPPSTVGRRVVCFTNLVLLKRDSPSRLFVAVADEETTCTPCAQDLPLAGQVRRWVADNEAALSAYRCRVQRLVHT